MGIAVSPSGLLPPFTAIPLFPGSVKWSNQCNGRAGQFNRKVAMLPQNFRPFAPYNDYGSAGWLDGRCLGNRRTLRHPCGKLGRGKSGLHRTRWWVTPTVRFDGLRTFPSRVAGEG